MKIENQAEAHTRRRRGIGLVFYKTLKEQTERALFFAKRAMNRIAAINPMKRGIIHEKKLAA